MLCSDLTFLCNGERRLRFADHAADVQMCFPSHGTSIMTVSACMDFTCERDEAQPMSDCTGPTALLASCDEMRDHVFQLLRPKYFRKWKQRHQVYYKCVLVACC